MRGTASIEPFPSSGRGSVISSSAPLPGKNPLIVIGNRYPAVSRAEIKRTIGPMTEIAPSPVLSEAETRFHFEIKPPIGGMPASDMAAMVRHQRTIGIFLPIPFIWRTSFKP